MREAAFSRFLERGFPTTRDEEWRFTNVAPIADTTFERATATTVARDVLEPFLFDEDAAAEIVVVNGRVSTSLSSLDALPRGVTIRSLREDWQASGNRPASEFAAVALRTSFVDL